MRILYMEDDEKEREYKSKLLSRWGYKIYSYASIHDAEQVLKEHGDEIDLGLYDMWINQDIKAGFELLQSTMNQHADICCVIFTGHESWENYAECTEAGAFSYIIKSVKIDLFRSTIQRAAKERIRQLRLSIDRQIVIWWAEKMNKFQDGIFKSIAPNDTNRIEICLVRFIINYRLSCLPPSNTSLKKINSLYPIQRNARLVPIQFENISFVLYVYSDLDSLPDPDPVLLAIFGDTIKEIGCKAKCERIGDWVNITISASGINVSPDNITRINLLLRGHGDTQDNTIGIVLFALRLTSFYGIAEVRILEDGSPALIIKMLVVDKPDKS